MTPKNYQAALDRLGLSHIQAAQELGITRQSSHRYATGVRPVPLTIELFLKLIENSRISSPQDLEQPN